MKPHLTINRLKGSYFSADQIAETKQEHQHSLSVKGIINLLLLITLILLVTHLVSFLIVYHDSGDSRFIPYLDMYFNFNRENNVPSFFSSLLLLFSSLLLWLIYKLTEIRDTYRKRWLLLAAIFLFLTLDEALKIHERINVFTSLIFTDNMGGYLTWTWIIPYMLLFLAVAIYNFRFVLQLPRSIRNTFMLAGCLFVFAAAAIESIEGRLMIITAEDPVVLMITTTIQELGEMISIILFISGLLRYLALTSKKLHLTIQ